MDMAEKEHIVCLITGANSGIGRAAAQDLAEYGATVVMVCRSQERGETARDAIMAKSGNDRVDLLLADLSSQQDIRRLVDDFRERYDRLDVLINNAGVYLHEYTPAEDEIETTFAVNHVASFLLTNLLMDALLASTPARIINVSSDAHRGVDTIDHLICDGGSYNGLRAYAQSKLANVLFTYELSRRLRRKKDVTVNAMHPGMTSTRIWDRNTNFLSWLMRLVKPFMHSAEPSGEALLHLATSPELEGVTGAYFDRTRKTRSSETSYDEVMARRLWRISEELVTPREAAEEEL